MSWHGGVDRIHLAQAPAGTLPLHELTASMLVADALSRSGLTRLLDRMERDGLVRRMVSPHDRRRFDVTLTPEGGGGSIRSGPSTRTGSSAISWSPWPDATSTNSAGSWTP